MRLRGLDREIFRLAGPAFVTLLAEPVYLLADTAVVGHLGTPQLGGLAVASTVLLTANSFCIFLAYGTTAAVARLLGAGRQRDAVHQAVQGVWLGALVGVALAVGIGLFSRPLLRVLGAEGDVLTYGLLYLRISLVGLPFLLVVLAGTGYLRGVQDTRTPLVVAVLTATLNLGLELFLVYGLGYGIGASAVGTVLAQMVGAAIYAVAVVRGARRFEVDLHPHPRTQRRLLVVARDLVVRTMSLRVALIVLTAVAARIGPVALAAHQISFEIWSFLAMALDALAIAAQAMVGHRLGGHLVREARDVSSRLLQLGLVAGVLSGIAVAALSPVLPRLFTDDPDVVHVASRLLLAAAVLQPVAAIAFVLDGVLIGASDQRFLARAMPVATAGLLLAIAPVLPLDLSVEWVWVAFGAFMLIRAGQLLARVRSDEWAVGGAAV